MSSVDMTRRIVELLSNLSQKRFSAIAQPFAQTIELIRPLLSLNLPKEIEPFTYLHYFGIVEGEVETET